MGQHHHWVRMRRGAEVVRRFGLAVATSVCLSSLANAQTLIGDLVTIEQNKTSSGTLRSDVVLVVDGSPELTCPGAFDLCSANIPGLSQGNFDIEEASLTLNVGPVGGPHVFIVEPFVGYIFSDLDPSGGADVTGVSRPVR